MNASLALANWREYPFKPFDSLVERRSESLVSHAEIVGVERDSGRDRAHGEDKMVQGFNRDIGHFYWNQSILVFDRLDLLENYQHS